MEWGGYVLSSCGCVTNCSHELCGLPAAAPKSHFVPRYFAVALCFCWEVGGKHSLAFWGRESENTGAIVSLNTVLV